jgi:hypothetical protein
VEFARIIDDREIVARLERVGESARGVMSGDV